MSAATRIAGVRRRLAGGWRHRCGVLAFLCLVGGTLLAQTGGTPAPGWYFMISRTSIPTAAPNVSNGYARFEADGTGLRIAEVRIPLFNSITYDPVAQSLGTGTTYSPTADTLGQPGSTGLLGNVLFNPGTVFRPTSLAGVYTFSGTLSWFTNGTNAIPSVPLAKSYLATPVDRWDNYVDLTGMGLGVLVQYVAADARLVATFRGGSGNSWLIEFYRTNIILPEGLLPVAAGTGGGGGGAGGGATESAPTFSRQPESIEVAAGATAYLTAAVSGNPSPTLQWRKDGVPIFGATGTLLPLGPASAANTGTYTLVATNSSGSVTSQPATFLSRRLPVVAAGTGQVFVLKTDGTLLTAGDNSYGQLGDGTTISRTAPVESVRDAQSMASAESHAMVVKLDGSLWVGGYNNFGQLGDGSSSTRTNYFRVDGDVTSAVARGLGFENYSMFVKKDGTLWGMGWNFYGQLGNGSRSNRLLPVQAATGVSSVAAGFNHAMFVKNDGTLWGVGFNGDGQLGDGSAGASNIRSSPVQVSSGVVAVTAGWDTSFFIRSDSTLWATGYRYAEGTPIQIATDVTGVSAGHSHAIFIKKDGSMWGLGDNTEGQLGVTSTVRPVQIASDVATAASGSRFTVFVKTDGSVWGMGQNHRGQLGDGTTTNRRTPVRLFEPAEGTFFAPVILAQPINRSVGEGGSVTFAVSATGAPAPSYQWRKDGVALVGATAATLTLNNVQGANAGAYTVVVANTAGSVTSTAAVLSVIAAVAPTVVVPPVPQLVNSGATATLAVIATGTAPLSYQWRRNGQAIAGATAATLAIAPALAANAGAYTVVVSNVAGSATSGEAALTIAAGGTTYTTAAAFSSTANPNGAWRAGFRTTAVSPALTVYTRTSTYSGGIVGWNNGNGEPNFTKHLGTVTQFGFEPGQIALHPGPGGEFSVLRFTAPVAGSAAVTARFFPGDSGATDVAVVAGRAGVATQLFAAVNAGTYTGTVTLAAGDTIDLVVGPRDGYANDTTPVEATIEIGTTSAPVVLTQPADRAVTAGGTTYFYVVASGVPAPTYQWRKDGGALAGATGSLLVRTNVTAADVGSYSVVVTNAAGSTTSAPATLALDTPATGGRLINLSILTALTPEYPSFKLGTVLGGRGTTGMKPLVVRAVGPSLSLFGLATGLPDPRLEIVGGGAVVAANDNWGGSQALTTAMAEVGAFVLPRADTRDAAVGPSFAAGDYVVEIAGVGGATGTVLAEIYDATPTAAFTATTPRLVNVSVLKHLGSGLTMGFVVGGGGPRTVLVRAIGPGLAAFGVAGLAADPRLELFNGASVSVAANDNWGGTTALSAAFAAVGAFGLEPASRDASIVATLAPGSYTVQVGGVGGTTGAALIEVYEVP